MNLPWWLSQSFFFSTNSIFIPLFLGMQLATIFFQVVFRIKYEIWKNKARQYSSRLPTSVRRMSWHNTGNVSHKIAIKQTKISVITCTIHYIPLQTLHNLPLAPSSPSFYSSFRSLLAQSCLCLKVSSKPTKTRLARHEWHMDSSNNSMDHESTSWVQVYVTSCACKW